MDVLLLTAALGAWLLVAVSVLYPGRPVPAWLERPRLPAAVAGLAMQLAGLVAYSVARHAPPVLAPGPSMAVLSCLVGAGYLWLGRRARMQAVGALLLPMVVVLLSLFFVLPSGLAIRDRPGANLLFPVHAVAIFLGVAAFALSCGTSATYLVVRSRLKRKRLDRLAHLPALDSLDRLNTRMLLAGFVSLTVGMATGGLWALTLEERPATLDATIYVTVVVWLWYAFTLQVRVVGGWRGRLAALLSVVGFAGMLVSLVAVNVLLRGWHA